MNSLMHRDKPLEVAVELSDPIPTDAESEADLNGLLNLSKVSASDMQRLRSAGLRVKRLGILETQRGVVYVTQAWLLGITSELNRLIQAKLKDEAVDTEEVCRLVEQVVKLAGKLGELSSVMQAQEPKAGHDAPPPPAPNAAFPAGAIVIGGNAQAHFHPKAAGEKEVAHPSNGA